MKLRLTAILLFACLFSSTANIAIAGDTVLQGLKIYMPREISVSGDTVYLEEVAVIRGAADMVKKVRKLVLGRFAMTGQQILINRRTIKTRLASQHISNALTSFSGSDCIIVKRSGQILNADDFAKTAKAYLKSDASMMSNFEFELSRKAKPLMLAGHKGDLKLIARPGKRSSSTITNVTIDVMADGKKIDSRDMSFRLKHRVRQVVARTGIAAGSMLGPENMKIEFVISDRPEKKGFKAPYGLITRSTLKPGDIISDRMLEKPEAVTIVKRNQIVVIAIETPMLSITAMGQALQDGACGEYIRVKNTNSNRLLLAKVNPDASVTPRY
jgi:flagella basal body P-ring formation protein FlgA